MMDRRENRVASPDGGQGQHSLAIRNHETPEQ